MLEIVQWYMYILVLHCTLEPGWQDRIQAQARCLAIWRPENWGSLSPTIVKQHSLRPQRKLGIRTLHQFLKSHGCQDMLPSPLTFYKTCRTLTTLSKRFLKCRLYRVTCRTFLKQAGEESVNGRSGGGGIVSLSIPIPTTTGLCKPLTDNAPDSLAPVLASLTDRVNHTSGLAGCTGARHVQTPAVVCGVPMMDVLWLVAATFRRLATLHFSGPFSSLFHSSILCLVAASVWSRLNQVGGLPPPAATRMSR